MAIATSALAGGAGAAQGLLEGIKLYYQIQNQQQDQAIKKRLANAQSLDAASKLYDIGGINPQTQDLMKQFGLLNGDSQNTAPLSQPSSSSDQMQSVQSSPLAQNTPTLGNYDLTSSSGGLLNGSGGSSSNQQIPNLAGLPRIQRQILAPGIEAKLKSDVELQTPQGQANYEKQLSDLHNSQTEQFNKGASDFKTAKDTFETGADAYGKLMRVSDEPTPKNVASAIMQVVKLDMPKQAARMGTIEQMESNPEIWQKWGDKIKEWRTGTPTETTLNDIKRVGTNLYQANSDEFRSAQEDERRIAKSRGVANPSYVNSSYADKMDKLAAKTKNNLPAYEAPGMGSAVSQAAPQGLIQFAKGLLPQGIGTSAQATQQHPQDQQAIQWAKQNPKDPRAKTILQLNGVQ